MAIVNQFVNALINAGADAHDNMYDVLIQFPWDSDRVTLTVRASGCEPPTPSTEVYQNEYHGNHIDLPKSNQTYEKKFNLTFRMDASYNLWGQFKTWHASVLDAVTGGISNWPGVLGKIEVRGLTGAYIATGMPTKDGSIVSADRNILFSYQYCYVVKVENPKWKTKGGDAMEYGVDFVFLDNDFLPFSNGAGLQNR
jgi:hypothetical protein